MKPPLELQLERVKLELLFGEQALELGVLFLESSHPLPATLVALPIASFPPVERLLTDSVALAQVHSSRTGGRLLKDLDDFSLGMSCRLHT